jgi:hypothetical protein
MLYRAWRSATNKAMTDEPGRSGNSLPGSHHNDHRGALVMADAEPITITVFGNLRDYEHSPNHQAHKSKRNLR